jgi:hypothetical protein
MRMILRSWIMQVPVLRPAFACYCHTEGSCWWSCCWWLLVELLVAVGGVVGVMLVVRDVYVLVLLLL